MFFPDDFRLPKYFMSRVQVRVDEFQVSEKKEEFQGAFDFFSMFQVGQERNRVFNDDHRVMCKNSRGT